MTDVITTRRMDQLGELAELEATDLILVARGEGPAQTAQAQALMDFMEANGVGAGNAAAAVAAAELAETHKEGAQTALAGAEAVKASLITLGGKNLWPDPFLKRWGDVPTYGVTGRWAGAWSRKDVDSPYGGGSLTAAPGGLLQFYLRLADSPIQPGEQETWAFLCDSTVSWQFEMQYESAIGVPVPGATAVRPNAAGRAVKEVTMVRPANAAWVRCRVSTTGAASTRKVLGVIHDRGPFTPGWAEAPQSLPPNEPDNLHPDPFNRLAARGVPTIDGHELAGRNHVPAVVWPEQDAILQAGTPFTTPALKLPAGAAAYDQRVPVDILGLKEGETVFWNMAWVGQQPVTVEFSWRNAAMAVIGASKVVTVDPRPGGVALAWGYGKTVGELDVSEDVVNGAKWLFARAFGAGTPVAANGAYLLAKPIYKDPADIDDDEGDEDSIRTLAMSSVRAPGMGQTMVMMGDSIGAGVDVTRDTLGNVVGVGGTHTVTHGLQRLLFRPVINVAIGGTTIGRRAAAVHYDALSGSALVAAKIAGGPWTAQDLAVAGNVEDFSAAANALARWKALDMTTVRTLVFQHSTNDVYAEQIPLGTEASNDRTTYMGAWRSTITAARAAWPWLRIVILAPIYRNRIVTPGDGNGEVTPNEPIDGSAGYTLRDARAALEVLSDRLKVPVVRMDVLTGFSAENYGATSPYTTAGDQLHPNTSAGQDRWVEAAAAGLGPVS
jgi:hypothetical protein